MWRSVAIWRDLHPTPEAGKITFGNLLRKKAVEEMIGRMKKRMGEATSPSFLSLLFIKKLLGAQL